MTTEEYSYFPEPCTDPTHEYGCPGRAGGEHRPKITAEPLSDDIRLEIGKILFDRFISADEVDSAGAHLPQATAWLEALGFGRIEWIQGDQDDILLLLLWRFSYVPPMDDPGPDRGVFLLDEFILEFAGFDAANITLFNMVKEVSL